MKHCKQYRWTIENGRPVLVPVDFTAQELAWFRGGRR